MESQKQEYIRRVKLKLELPNIRCSGRKDVSCYYRGKVLKETDEYMIIEFKIHGQTIKEEWDKKLNCFKPHSIQDIKLV
jgi:hypothetical protein